MSFKEVDTQVSTNVEWKVAPTGEAANFRTVVNFDPWIYAIHSDSLPTLDDDLGKYFAECLMLSTQGEMVLDKDEGFLHSSGVSYRKLIDRAIKHYEGNQVAVERFFAEGLGFDRGQKLVEYFMELGAALPPFIITSPPGNTYDVGEKYSKSMTYVAIPCGYDVMGRPKFRLVSIPTKEISVNDHWVIVNEVANIQRSLEIFGMEKPDITANGLVQLPGLLPSIKELPDSLDRLAKALNFQSWDDIEKDIRTASLLEMDNDRTRIRRKSMLSWAARVIRELVADGQSKVEFDALQETLRQVFAAERGGKYTTDIYLDHERVVLEIEQLFVGNGGSPEYAKLFVKHSMKQVAMRQSVSWANGDLSYNDSIYLLAQRVRRNMIGWIGGNADALDTYVGTGCGSGGGSTRQLDTFSIGYHNSSLTDVFGYESQSITDIFGYESTTTTYSEESSTGKYKEYYDYYFDTCRGPCGSEKPYVAHPKSPDIPCGYWCSDCET